MPPSRVPDTGIVAETASLPLAVGQVVAALADDDIIVLVTMAAQVRANAESPPTTARLRLVLRR